MKKIFIVVFMLQSFIANAQLAEDSVKQTINRMFQGMKDADSAIVVSTFASGALLQTITKDGIRPQAVKDFGAAMSKLKKGQLDERISFGAIHIDGPLASVWTPYRLYVDGKFIHCGVNSFQLVRTNGEWKIVYLIDTRRKDCAPEQ
jgi:hypothetical protein